MRQSSISTILLKMCFFSFTQKKLEKCLNHLIIWCNFESRTNSVMVLFPKSLIKTVLPKMHKATQSIRYEIES